MANYLIAVTSVSTMVLAFYLLSRITAFRKKHTHLSSAEKRAKANANVIAANELDFAGPHSAFQSERHDDGRFAIETEDARFEAPESFNGRVKIKTTLTRIEIDCRSNGNPLVTVNAKAAATDAALGYAVNVEAATQENTSPIPAVKHAERFHAFARMTGSLAAITRMTHDMSHFIVELLRKFVEFFFGGGGKWQL